MTELWAEKHNALICLTYHMLLSGNWVGAGGRRAGGNGGGGGGGVKSIIPKAHGVRVRVGLVSIRKISIQFIRGR